MRAFLSGGLFVASLIAGLFFARYWRVTRDRLFIYFSLAFTVLALHWAIVGLELTSAARQYQTYVLRLVAFALIIVGIVDKNRRRHTDRASGPGG